MSATPTMSEVLARIFNASAARIRVALPGKVERYDSARQTVDVKPAEDLSVINDVPVLFMGSGGVRVRFPIRAGDHVLLIFADSSIEEFLTTGRLVTPADKRRHSVNDAFAIPGIQPFVSVGDADAVIEFTDDGEIHAGGDEALVTKSEFEAHIHSGVTTGGGSSGTIVNPITGTQVLKGG